MKTVCISETLVWIYTSPRGVTTQKGSWFCLCPCGKFRQLTYRHGESSEKLNYLMSHVRVATYRDPRDVGRCCGNLLIGHVHLNRQPPHSTHATRTDMPQVLRDAGAFCNATWLCLRNKLSDVSVWDSPLPTTQGARAENRPVARHAHLKKANSPSGPVAWIHCSKTRLNTARK
jgi:hypothetical protein